jgi:transketolase
MKASLMDSLTVANEILIILRMPRQPREIISEERNIRFGKMEVLKKGEDLAIFATGPMVEEAQLAAEILKKDGLDAAVLSSMTIKPLDEETICAYAKKVKAIFTVEEHSVVNGFGSAVAQSVSAMGEKAPVYVLGIQEGSKNTGPYRELLEYYSLTGEKIAEKIKKMIKEL